MVRKLRNLSDAPSVVGSGQNPDADGDLNLGQQLKKPYPEGAAGQSQDWSAEYEVRKHNSNDPEYKDHHGCTVQGLSTGMGKKSCQKDYSTDNLYYSKQLFQQDVAVIKAEDSFFNGTQDSQDTQDQKEKTCDNSKSFDGHNSLHGELPGESSVMMH